MKKVFVLDTNVLLHDPAAMHQFEDNDVVLPMTIIEELDRFKKQPEETGRNARQVSRDLDSLRQEGNLFEGIILKGGGSLKVALCSRETLKELPPELERDRGDNSILAVALELKRQCNCPLVLVSKDTNLRLKADALSLAAEDYETDKVNVGDLYTGISEVMTDAETMNNLFKQGGVTLEGSFSPNQTLTLVDSVNPAHTALAIVDGNSRQIQPLAKIPHAGISQVIPRNREQPLRFRAAVARISFSADVGGQGRDGEDFTCDRSRSTTGCRRAAL